MRFEVFETTGCTEIPIPTFFTYLMLQLFWDVDIVTLEMAVFVSVTFSN